MSGAQAGPPVAAGFVGLATEYWNVESETGMNPAAPDVPFEHVARSLAPYGGLILRVGGDSTDWTWWPVPGMMKPPWVQWTMTPTWAAVTKRLAQDLNAHLILGINMEANDTRIASTEIHEIQSSIGPVPITFELGNEPELYSHFNFYHSHSGKPVKGRPPGYSYADITSQWNRMADALPKVRWAGPGYASFKAQPYVGQFLDTSHRLSLLTVHSYPLKYKRCAAQTAPLNEDQLFTPASLQTLAGDLSSWTAVARPRGVGVRVDEMNSVTCGGAPVFSRTLGPALWALNILPLYAEAGADGVNFQNKPNSAQNLIQTTQTKAGWRVDVQPEYYGMAAFAQLTPPGSKMLRVASVPNGLEAWAVRTPKGQEHVVVTNVTGKTVPIQIPGARGPATVEVLKAGSGSLWAMHNVTLGGQTVDPATGLLSGRLVTTTVHSSSGAYDVDVARNSAAIVTFR
ncbi:MAG: glycosyl hydrolase family 79 C-terminal domain-containing protein [Conexibacteraceae bacterium]|nr:glycosyl hydrolase family 79 C-terminal domain-containing protein [Conexibacteraceae bacterium]